MNRENSVVDMAKLKELFGRPPVLSTECELAYYEIMERLFACLGPSDFLMQDFVREIADCIWERIRYTRHKSLAIERRFQARRETEAKRAKQLAERKEVRARERAEQSQKPADELDRWSQLDDIVEGSPEDIDMLLTLPADDLDHARGLEEGIDYIERLDKLINSATLRYNNALNQLERYKELQAALRSVSEAAVAEYSAIKPESRQVKAPSIAPKE
jgi:hypothetical protein